MSFPGGSDDKESASIARDLGSIPGLGRSPEEEMESTPVFLPGEFHGQRSLAGHKENNTFKKIPAGFFF